MSTRRKGIIWYLLIAYVPAWVIWEVVLKFAPAAANPLSLQLFILPGAVFPAVASLVVRRWITREGFGDAGLRLRYRESWRFYLVGWLLPIGVVAVIAALAALFGIAQPDFSLKSGLRMLTQGHGGTPPPAALSYLLPVALLGQAALFTPVLWGEEFGWRGYLQLRLFPGRPLPAAIVTGIIWGLWHLPINIRGYNFPGFPVLGMVVFTVSTVLLSIIFGWLRTQSGSVWAPSLAHAATNSVGGSLTLMIFAAGSAGANRATTLFVAYLGVLSWIPLGGLCLWIVLTGRLRPREA